MSSQNKKRVAMATAVFRNGRADRGLEIPATGCSSAIHTYLGGKNRSLAQLLACCSQGWGSLRLPLEKQPLCPRGARDVDTPGRNVG